MQSIVCVGMNSRVYRILRKNSFFRSEFKKERIRFCLFNRLNSEVNNNQQKTEFKKKLKNFVFDQVESQI